jgi:hypothetical protein
MREKIVFSIKNHVEHLPFIQAEHIIRYSEYMIQEICQNVDSFKEGLSQEYIAASLELARKMFEKSH